MWQNVIGKKIIVGSCVSGKTICHIRIIGKKKEKKSGIISELLKK